MHCSWVPQTSLLSHFLLKMGLTAQFIYLKIILLQYFQFSVFSKNKLYPNKPLVEPTIKGYLTTQIGMYCLP